MQKSVMACIIAGGAGFLFMGYQTGMFGSGRSPSDVPEVKVEAKVEVKKPLAKFPEDLAPSARAQPVAAAADFKVAEKPHKLVWLKVNGTPHAWQKLAGDYHEDWTATNVEETELAVIVSGQTKTNVEHITFVNGPPVDRVKWEVEASVVEAKTGKVVANRTFVNMPRPIRPREAYELTELGQPVQYLTVYEWVANQSRRGWSASQNAKPLVITVEKQ